MIYKEVQTIDAGKVEIYFLEWDLFLIFLRQVIVSQRELNTFPTSYMELE